MKDKQYWLKWAKAAARRALKTAAQTFVATIGTTATIGGVDWKLVGSTAALAAILSLGTSLAGLPEVEPTSDTEEDFK
jgi:hypothetical protein